MDIRELNEKISGIVARQAELRKQIDAIVADLEAAYLETVKTEQKKITGKKKP
ncbi:hypothetical protein D3C84_1181470 [compost metagenome]